MSMASFPSSPRTEALRQVITAHGTTSSHRGWLGPGLGWQSTGSLGEHGNLASKQRRCLLAGGRHRGDVGAQKLEHPPCQAQLTEFSSGAERRKRVLTCPAQNHLIDVTFPVSVLCQLLATCSYLSIQAFCAAGPLNHSLGGCISFPFKCSYLK